MKRFLFILLGITTILSSAVILQAQRKTLNITETNPAIERIPELKSALSLQTVLRGISKNITPGVVSIDVEGISEVPNQFGNDPLFRYFFGNNEQLQRQYSSAGSGFIITSDGYLFSNFHVVKDASKIKVTLADGREFDAKLIGADTELDIALLKIEGKNLPVVPLGDSQNTEVGDLVVAIGNPFGLAGSFTFGTVSGIGRDGVLPGLQRFIQSDVAVNPGNSGGPLLNLRGQAIGINTAIRSQSGGYEGISFAIPINVAKNIAEQLFSTGTIERGFLGIVPQELDTVTRRSLRLKEKEGILISSVENQGPADKQGLKQGDIITAVNGSMISDPRQLTEQISSVPPNTTVEITILRNGRRQTIPIILGRRPSNVVRMDKDENGKNSQSYGTNLELRGVTFASASSRDLQENGAPNGVVVTSVNPNSPLAFILSTGDIVASINNIAINNIDDLSKASPNLENSRSLTFAVYKGGYLVYRSIEF